MSKNSDDKFSNDEFGVEGPAWADGKIINEAIFCEEFLSKHKIIFSGGSFFIRRSIFLGSTHDGAALRLQCCWVSGRAWAGIWWCFWRHCSQCPMSFMRRPTWTAATA